MVEHRTEVFQVDLRGLLDLLSDHLYSAPDVFLRELLQNAVDAITARKRLDDDFEGKVTVECDEKGRTLTMIDDGLGLSAEEVREFLSRVGASIKRGDAVDRSTYLGQFGIGILSCFTVAEELVVLTRRFGDDHPGLRWTAQPGGTYEIRPVTKNLNVGTRVILRLRQDAARYATYSVVASLLQRFGRYLETPILLGEEDWPINEEAAPWRIDPADADSKSSALQNFQSRTGFAALDLIPLDDPALGLRGAAYVLPQLRANATEQTHEVYLKGMFVTDAPGKLLPRWAGFTRCILTSDRLKPTASRESFCEDEVFWKVRESISERLRAYLVRLARDDRLRLAAILEMQDDAFRRLAMEEDDFFDTVIDMLSFETSLGRMAFGEFRRENFVVRFCSTIDQFRSIAALAAARNMIVFNGGYTNHEELLEKAVSRDPTLTLEPVDGRELAEQLGPPSPGDAAAFERIASQLEQALSAFGVKPKLKSFAPADVAAVYAEGPDSNLARSLRSAREMSSGMWLELLDAAATTVRTDDEIVVLCLNASNSVVQQLLRLDDAQAVGDTAKLLYVQALLLSQQPLTTEETTAFSAALTGILSRLLDRPEGSRTGGAP